MVLGGLLSTKEVSYNSWSRLLERVNWQLKQDETNCLEILALSYVDLPNYLKPCYTYFGLFPKDYEISIRRLNGLWLVEWLVQPRDNESLEDIVEEYVDELIDRSMIQVAERRRSNGKTKTCHMHDLLRDIALPKARKTNFFHIYGKRESTSTKEEFTSTEKVNIRRHIAHYNVDKGPSSIYHLRSYFVFAPRFEWVDGESISKFLDNGIQNKGFGLYKILDLEGVCQPWLPEALGQLIHFRYLGLRQTKSRKWVESINSLPYSLGNMRNLQTLDIKYSKITISDRPIWKLQQLRHLYLNGDEDSKIMHSPINSSSNSFSLINLRTLSGVYIDNSMHLKKLKICGNLASQGQSLSNWFLKLDKLKVLTLEASAGKEFSNRLPTMMPFSNNMHLCKLPLEGRFVEKLLEVHEFPPNLTVSP